MYPRSVQLLLRNMANLLLVSGLLAISDELTGAGSGTSKTRAPKQEPAKYTAEEYKAFQAITGEADPAKKMELIAKFLQDRPQSALRQNVVADYYGMLQKLQGEEKWPDLVAAGERFLTLVPDDELTVSALAARLSENQRSEKVRCLRRKGLRQETGGIHRVLPGPGLQGSQERRQIHRVGRKDGRVVAGQSRDPARADQEIRGSKEERSGCEVCPADRQSPAIRLRSQRGPRINSGRITRLTPMPPATTSLETSRTNSRTTEGQSQIWKTR